MGNVVVAIPVGGSSGMGFQPYVTAGLGTIRTQLRSESSASRVARQCSKLGIPWRKGFVPPVPVAGDANGEAETAAGTDDSGADGARPRSRWRADLMQRSFEFDVLACPPVRAV